MDTSNVPQNNSAGPMTRCIGTTTKYMPTQIEDNFLMRDCDVVVASALRKEAV